MALTTAQIQQAYVTFFNRPADVAGLNYWAQYQGSLVDLHRTFAQSAEYTSLFTGQNPSQIVNTIYQNLFNRAPDVTGLNYWVLELNTGKLDIGTVANAIAYGAQGTDKTIVDNKTSAATSFTNALDTAAEILAYASASATGVAVVKAWLSSVSSAAASLTAATAAIPTTLTTATISPAVTGQTFTLTTAAGETITGTAGNDTFTAILGGDDRTIQAADTIVGGLGTDTLNITVDAGGTAVPSGFTVREVEIVNLNVSNFAAPTGLLTPAAFTGVQQLWQVNSSNAVGTNTAFSGVTGVGATTTVGFRTSGATATAVLVNNIVAATATATSLSVALDGVGSGSTITLGGAAVRTVNVSGSLALEGTGNAGNLTLTEGTSEAIQTLNLAMTSGVDLALTGTFGSLRTIDASASTGAIRANGTHGDAVDTAESVLATLKSGSGNDNIAVVLGSTRALTIDLGAGNDTLTITGEALEESVEITLGAGRDRLVIGTADDGLVTLNNGVTTVAELTEGMIVVTDFDTSQDVLDLSNVNGVRLLATDLATIGAAADLRLAIIAAAGEIGAAASAVFGFGEDSYVFVNDDAAALGVGDALIKLVGVTVTDLSSGQNGNLVLS